MFNFLTGMLQEQSEMERLRELETRLKSASILKKKHCVRCSYCCHQRTCTPTPNELKKIAKFLKMTPTELIEKYYAIDRKTGSNVYYVKPVGENIKDLIGGFISSSRTWNEGKCIFLKKKSCKIYPVRPKTAQVMKCWEGNEEEQDINYKNILDSWKGNKLKKEFGFNGEELENYGDEYGAE